MVLCNRELHARNDDDEFLPSLKILPEFNVLGKQLIISLH